MIVMKLNLIKEMCNKVGYKFRYDEKHGVCNISIYKNTKGFGVSFQCNVDIDIHTLEIMCDEAINNLNCMNATASKNYYTKLSQLVYGNHFEWKGLEKYVELSKLEKGDTVIIQTLFDTNIAGRIKCVDDIRLLISDNTLLYQVPWRVIKEIHLLDKERKSNDKNNKW